MRGGQANEQWMKNALASGSITPPAGIGPRPSRAWLIVTGAGIATIIVAAILL
jgi:hypothetical protein